MLRFGVSSAVRNPTLQDQYLYYNVGRALLLGNLNGYDSLVTIDEVQQFLGAGVQERSSWVWDYYNREAVRPEQVRNAEVGLRTTLWKKLYVDATYYYSWYTDFIGYHIGLKIEDDPGPPFSQITTGADSAEDGYAQKNRLWDPSAFEGKVPAYEQGQVSPFLKDGSSFTMKGF